MRACARCSHRARRRRGSSAAAGARRGHAQEGLHRQQALDEQRTNHTRALAKLREDEARLAKTVMRAPFPGVAGLRQVSEGAYVAAGTDIARLEKIDQLKLDFRVPEAYLGAAEGRPAASAYRSTPIRRGFPGAIYAIEPAVDEQTRTVLVRARVANADLKLRPGMFARVQLQLGVREKAVWIPEQAIVPRGQDASCSAWRTARPSWSRCRPARARSARSRSCKGIAAGDLVVTEGTQRIGPGSAVTSMGDRQRPAACRPPKERRSRTACSCPRSASAARCSPR